MPVRGRTVTRNLKCEYSDSKSLWNSCVEFIFIPDSVLVSNLRLSYSTSTVSEYSLDCQHLRAHDMAYPHHNDTSHCIPLHFAYFGDHCNNRNPNNKQASSCVVNVYLTLAEISFAKHVFPFKMPISITTMIDTIRSNIRIATPGLVPAMSASPLPLEAWVIACSGEVWYPPVAALWEDSVVESRPMKSKCCIMADDNYYCYWMHGQYIMNYGHYPTLGVISRISTYSRK